MSAQLGKISVAAALAATLAIGACFAAIAAAAPLKQLRGGQIRVAFGGQEFTDEVHWAERYQADGSVTGKSMGRDIHKRWSIKADLLCLRDDKAAADSAEDCFEVWKADAKVELRLVGGDAFPKEGILRRAAR